MAAHARDVNILIWTSRKSVGLETNDRVMVHGEGRRADGRRSGIAPHLDEIVVARDGRAAASSIFWPILSADKGALASLGQVWVPRPLGCCIDGVSGAGAYPLPDLPREASRSRSAPEKSVQFGPDGAPFPSKTSITRGPPVVAVAVSLGPILPHR